MSPIRVAVVGAGMAGRAHANGYRNASSVYGLDLPEVRLVAIADAHEPFAADAARPLRLRTRGDELGGDRRGARHRRGQRRGRQLAAPRGRRGAARRRQARAVREAAGPDRRGRRRRWSTPPRSPTGSPRSASPSAARPRSTRSAEQVTDGTLGPVRHFNGRYWCDYGCHPDAPMSWRYTGRPRLRRARRHRQPPRRPRPSCSAARSTGIRGAVLRHRDHGPAPVPLGAAVGHAGGRRGQRRSASRSSNEDLATFTADVRGRRGRHVLGLPRRVRARQRPRRSTCFGERGAASFDLERGGRVRDRRRPAPARSPTGCRAGADRPRPPVHRARPADGLPRRRPRRRTTSSPSRRARSSTRSPGTSGLPACPSLAHGLHNLRVLEAVTASAVDGTSVDVP